MGFKTAQSASCAEDIRVLDRENATLATWTDEADTTSQVSAIIISWEGMYPAARAIAEDLADSVDSLFVIYSNDLDEREEGPGLWHQVPQSWYFGRKFADALQVVPEDTTLLTCSHVLAPTSPCTDHSCADGDPRPSGVPAWQCLPAPA